MYGGAKAALFHLAVAAAIVSLSLVLQGGRAEAATPRCTWAYQNHSQGSGCYPDQTLFQGGGDSTVWVTSHGQVWGVTGDGFSRCFGGNWGRVYHPEASEYRYVMSGYANGGTYPCLSQNQMYQDGDGSVWVRRGGYYFGVSGRDNARAVGCLGGWSAVAGLSQPELAEAQSHQPYGGTYVCYPDGSLLKGSDASVWLVRSDAYWGVPGDGTINCLGGWGAVKSVPDQEVSDLLRAYPYGGNAGCSNTDQRSPAAVTWARQLADSGATTQPDGHPWNNWCERFAENAYGTQYRFGTAHDDYVAQSNAGRIHRDSSVPYGALVYYDSWMKNDQGQYQNYGHVMINVDGGDLYVTVGPHVHYAHRGDFSGYLGWAYAPPDWSGR